MATVFFAAGCGKQEGYSRGTAYVSEGATVTILPPTISLSTRSAGIIVGTGTGTANNPLLLTNIVAGNSIRLTAWTVESVSSFSCSGSGTWTSSLNATKKTLSLIWTIAPVASTVFTCTATNEGGTGYFYLQLN